MEAPADKLIRAITKHLASLPAVSSVVLKGSRARGDADIWSDVDLALGVRFGTGAEVLDAVASFVRASGPVDLDHEVVKDLHRIFHVDGWSDYLVLEVSIWHYDERIPQIAEVPQRFFSEILFDRFGRLKTRSTLPTRSEVIEWLRQVEVETSAPFLASRVYKHLNRRDVVAAMMAFQVYALKPLLRAYRLRFSPETWSQGTASIDRDVPKRVFDEIPLPRRHTIPAIERATALVIADLRRISAELKCEWSDQRRSAVVSENAATDPSRRAA